MKWSFDNATTKTLVEGLGDGELIGAYLYPTIQRVLLEVNDNNKFYALDYDEDEATPLIGVPEKIYVDSAEIKNIDKFYLYGTQNNKQGSSLVKYQYSSLGENY